MILRKTDPAEKRSNIPRLSDEGQHLPGAVRLAWNDVDRIIEDAIGSEKAERLARLTYDLRNALGGRIPGAGS